MDDLGVFFAVQRVRIQQVDGSALDRTIRERRFRTPSKLLTTTHDRHSVADNPHSIGTGYDSVKAGYAKLRLLYV